jgi:hypothetical protein
MFQGSGFVQFVEKSVDLRIHSKDTLEYKTAFLGAKVI